MVTGIYDSVPMRIIRLKLRPAGLVKNILIKSESILKHIINIHIFVPGSTHNTSRIQLS
jgi:hypothetical protein